MFPITAGLPTEVKALFLHIQTVPVSKGLDKRTPYLYEFYKVIWFTGLQRIPKPISFDYYEIFPAGWKVYLSKLYYIM